MTVILGIDGSLTATGWTRVEVRPGEPPHVLAEGCIRTEKHQGPTRIYAADDDGRRIDQIASALSFQMRAADWIAVEAPAGSRSSVSAKALGLVYGCVRALACMSGKPVLVVQAGECKRVTCGRRDASKADVIAWADGWARLIEAPSGVSREAIADARAVVRAALESPVLRGGAV